MPEKGLFCGTNKPKDAANVTEFEKTHMPVVECPSEVKAGVPFQVKIKVGEIPHVNEEGHFIQWIEARFGENLYARVEFTPVFAMPEVVLTLVKHGKHDSGTLRIIERCNLHGLWETTKEIAIN